MFHENQADIQIETIRKSLKQELLLANPVFEVEKKQLSYKKLPYPFLSAYMPIIG